MSHYTCTIFHSSRRTDRSKQLDPIIARCLRLLNCSFRERWPQRRLEIDCFFKSLIVRSAIYIKSPAGRVDGNLHRKPLCLPTSWLCQQSQRFADHCIYLYPTICHLLLKNLYSDINCREGRGVNTSRTACEELFLCMLIPAIPFFYYPFS